MLRGSVTASLIGYVLLMHEKEFGQLLIGISSPLEKISRGLYYERMRLSYLCRAEYEDAYSDKLNVLICQLYVHRLDCARCMQVTY